MKVRKLTAALMAMVMIFSLICSSVGSMGVRAAETEDRNYGGQPYRVLGASKEKVEFSGAKSYVPKEESYILRKKSDDAKKLPSGTINYTYKYRECRQIPNEAQEGIYFLNNKELLFYSFSTEESKNVYTFESGVKDSYVAGGKLYVIPDSGKGIDVYNLDSMSFEKTIDVSLSSSAIGVDAQGRIYLCCYENSYQIYLLTAEGKVIAHAAAPSQVYKFGGFDSVTGNFYFECYYNWVYWGYEHDTRAVGVGNVSGNSMEVGDKILQTISQSYYSDKQRSMELLGDKYLCVDSPLYTTGNLMNPYYSGLFIWNSRKSDLASESFSLQTALGRSYVESEQYPGCESVGPRCVYNEENDSVITYIDNGTLAEYSMETESFIGSYSTAYPVFALETYGDYIVAVERDNNDFYLELIEWKHADQLEIVNGSSNMKAGETMQLEVSSNGMIEEEYTWESSDSKIVSVTKYGKVTAWHEGTATVTISNGVGRTASFTITVEARLETGETYPDSLKLEGKLSSNISRNDYSGRNWSSTVNSYLVDNEDGSLTRVENMGDSVLVETYDKTTGALKESKTISLELPLFGGFYSGTEYNYLVFGQKNMEESDENEVLRIVKYSKNWERLQDVSVYGANTYIPFDAGSLRMTETEDRLYVYTCHEMYVSDDGYHHQSNMTFVVEESTMTIKDSYYDVMNISQAGYVSHSFNQFIQTDGNFIYRVDHGDANPRAVSITRCVVGGSIQNVSYTLPYAISGYTGDNYTGVSIGGFELSSDTCLIAGTSVKQNATSEEYYGQRNIFLTVTDKSFNNNTKVLWLTKHTGNNIDVRTPQLVKLGEDQFLLMWEEHNRSTDSIVTCMVTLDGYGNCTSDVSTSIMRLSDCQPIVGADGLVRWYQTDGDKVTLCTIDPLAIPNRSSFKMMGDVDGDGEITANDALAVLKYSLGQSVHFFIEQAADVNKDDKIDSKDALAILKYNLGLLDEFY